MNFTLPSQPQLNDPFDCQPVFEKGVSQDDYSALIHPVICAIRTEMAREISSYRFSPEEMCSIIAENIASDPALSAREAYEVKLDKMIVDMFSTMGILSLTSDKNNLVMWAMYANRGNGICLELEGLRLT